MLYYKEILVIRSIVHLFGHTVKILRVRNKLETIFHGETHNEQETQPGKFHASLPSHSRKYQVFFPAFYFPSLFILTVQRGEGLA